MGGRYRPPMDLRRDQPQPSDPLAIRLQKKRITDSDGDRKSANDCHRELSSESTWSQHKHDAELIQAQKSRIAELEQEIQDYEDLLSELPTEPTWNQTQRDAELIQAQKNRIADLENEHQRDAEIIQFQQSRVKKLDGEIKAYEDLLAELPEVFERRFQQRLEPFIERYQQLAQRFDQEQTQPALPGSSEPENVVRFPGLRLPKFLQKGHHSA